MNESVHVAFVATECVPFIKVGGLADVIGSLPRALEQCGARVDVIIPQEPIDPSWVGAGTSDLLRVSVGGETIQARAQRTTLPGSNVRVWMIEGGGFFSRGGLYVDAATGADYPDQVERWVFFQKAALALLERECPEIEVVHCHEHQTSLIPSYLTHSVGQHPAVADTPTVLTIHNLGYQGVFPYERRGSLDLPTSLSQPGGPLEFYGQLNFMKCGIRSADAVTVVSPTYAQEIQTSDFGYGLDGVVADRRSDLFGILNGIDTVAWNPEQDPRIHSRYSSTKPEGKRENRRHLLRTFGLNPDADGPVLAMVSRIDAHKGFDLLLSILDEILREPVTFVLVGTGDTGLVRRLETIASTCPDKTGVRIAFDETLAHQVIAGADIFLMPSRYEPCGLTQMYALRYGTVPVVRSTGGLRDTVQEFNMNTGLGNGFSFSSYDPGDFRAAIGRAISAWNSPHWPAIMKNGMESDFSWTASALRFLEVYEHARGNHKPSVSSGRPGP